MHIFLRSVRYRVASTVGILLFGFGALPADGVTINHYVTSQPGGGPFALAPGPDAAMWFTELSANKIGRITSTGVISEFSIPTPDSFPQSIALGADGNLWFTERNVGKIGRITPLGVITEFPIPTPDRYPLSIASGPDGRLWFCLSAAGSRVGRMTTSGVYDELLLTPLVPLDPNALASGPDGNMWFLANYLFGRITTSGTATTFPWPSSEGELMAICSGPDSNLWFGTHYSGAIARVTPSGTMTVFPPPDPMHYNQMNGITPGPDGNVWYLRLTLLGYAGTSVVGRITPDGALTEFPTQGGAAIAAGPDGNIWFTVGDGVCQLVIGSVPPPSGAAAVPTLSLLPLMIFGALLAFAGIAFLNE